MLIERWHPVTHDLGLVNAPIHACVEAFRSWHESIALRYSVRTVNSSLAEALDCLPPLSAEMRCKLFVSTTSGWTAFFQSGIQGSDPFPIMSMLAKILGVEAMRVCAAPDGAMSPGVIWEVYASPELGGQPPLGYRRTISASNDGGRWVFDQSGKPFAFEHLESYTRTRKRDRFTRELLAEYLNQFGLAPFLDKFYVVSDQSPAVVLDSESRWDRTPPEFTLAQVVSGVPWQGGKSLSPPPAID